jgi:DNA-binding transcriptional LysR family regulator
MQTPAQVTALREGAIDVGFGRHPGAATDLATEPLVEEPLVAVVPEDHRLARMPEVPVEALVGEPPILFPRELTSEFYDQIVDLFRHDGAEPTVAQRAPDLHAQLGLVAAGIGFTVHLASVSTLARHGLAFLPLSDPAPTATLLAISRRNDDRPLLAAWLETTRAVARSAPARFGGRSITDQQ